MRLPPRFCGWQVTNTHLNEPFSFLYRGKHSASATPLSPIRSSHRRGPDFLTAELPASKGMPPLFSQPLNVARRRGGHAHPGERVADWAEACEVLFSHNPVGVVTPDWSSWRHGWWFWSQHAELGTSGCPRAEPSGALQRCVTWRSGLSGSRRRGRRAQVSLREPDAVLSTWRLQKEVETDPLVLFYQKDEDGSK